MINLKLSKHRIRFSTEFISFIPLEPRHRHLVSLKKQSPSMSKLTFQPGLKFECDYMRFLCGISARVEISSPVCEIQPGLIVSPCNRNVFHLSLGCHIGSLRLVSVDAIQRLGATRDGSIRTGSKFSKYNRYTPSPLSPCLMDTLSLTFLFLWLWLLILFLSCNF